MDIEEKFEKMVSQLVDQFSEKFRDSVKDIHSEVMPFIETDTIFNAHRIAEEAVNNLLCGEFVPCDDGARVRSGEDIDVRIRVTSEQVDDLRKTLIGVMPKCPKDLEIEALKQRIQNLERSIRSQPF